MDEDESQGEDRADDDREQGSEAGGDDYEQKARELESDERSLEERASDLGSDIESTRSEWESAKGDPNVPGAQEPETAAPGGADPDEVRDEDGEESENDEAAEDDSESEDEEAAESDAESEDDEADEDDEQG